MKKASIISIGNEIMTGQIVDSNAAYLSAKLFAIGVPTAQVFQVGDYVDQIANTISWAAGISDFIIITGGLGPTDDDVTRQALAKYLGTDLELRQDLLNVIEGFFQKRGIEMPALNRIQACIPKGADAIENPTGTAPGIFAWHKGKMIAVMPGVPSEMKLMFETSVIPEIIRHVEGQAVVFKKLKCFGAGESHIAQMLGDMMNRDRNPQVNCTVQFGVISLHILAWAANLKKAQELADSDERTLRTILGDLVFGENEETLAQVVGNQLARMNQTLATAESCTGGLVAKLITDIPGSSRYFTHGWVTYANQAKIDQLGVPAELIANNGAVSEPVAAAMAKGALEKSGADYVISITGIAGPEGGTKDKPVGLVYISIADKNQCHVEKFVFPHTRDFMRLRSAQTALNLLRLKLRI